MMVFKKALPRRAFLRGLGATVALPLLDGMIPALASGPEKVAAPTRVGFVYFPNGAIMHQWLPATKGPDFKVSRILKPLPPVHDQLLVPVGLKNNQPQAPQRRHVTGDTTPA